MVDGIDPLIAKHAADLKEEQHIDVNVLHDVQEIDLKQGKILVEKIDSGRTHWESFDRLMLATGASPTTPPVEGIDAEGIFGVNTLQSGLDLKRFLRENEPENAVVVGGGYIGLEMAELDLSYAPPYSPLWDPVAVAARVAARKV